MGLEVQAQKFVRVELERKKWGKKKLFKILKQKQ
jgi:hypothetical protein